MPPKCNHIGQIKEKELSREEIAGVCQVFAASSFGFQFFYEITENKKSANEHLTQTKQRKTLKKNLICAILNTVAQAANFDTIGGNYYVQI